MIPIDQIEMFASANEYSVRCYVQMLGHQGDRTAPPILVSRQDSARFRYKMIDGHNRCAAALATGRRRIKASIIATSEADKNE
jgi:hypothetical protein